MIRERMRGLTPLALLLLTLCACRADTSQPPEPVAVEDEEPEGDPPEGDPPEDVSPPVVTGTTTREKRERTVEEKLEMDFEIPEPTLRSEPAAPGVECCRTCRSGKACGNTCIAAERSCNKPPGCACNG